MQRTRILFPVPTILQFWQFIGVSHSGCDTPFWSYTHVHAWYTLIQTHAYSQKLKTNFFFFF